jgi:hypothetical protein
MINTAYINGFAGVIEDTKLYEETVNSIEDIVNPLRILKMQREDQMDLGIYEESADDYYEESAKDTITKLGSKIIEILNRIKDFIKNIPNMIKDVKFTKSNVEKKADMIRKEDPKRYEQLQVYVEKGLLDFNTFDSMKDYYKNVDDLIDELKKKDVNEKSLKGKLEKVKKGIEKNQDTIKTVSVLVGIVGTGAAIAVNWKKFKSYGDDKLQTDTRNQSDAAFKRVQELEMVQRSIDHPTIEMTSAHTKGYVAAQLAAELERNTRVNISAASKLRVAIWKKFDQAVGVVKQNPVDIEGMASNIATETDRMRNVAQFNRANYNTQVENVLRQRH